MGTTAPMPRSLKADSTKFRPGRPGRDMTGPPVATCGSVPARTPSRAFMPLHNGHDLERLRRELRQAARTKYSALRLRTSFWLRSLPRSTPLRLKPARRVEAGVARAALPTGGSPDAARQRHSPSRATGQRPAHCPRQFRGRLRGRFHVPDRRRPLFGSRSGRLRSGGRSRTAEPSP